MEVKTQSWHFGKGFLGVLPSSCKEFIVSYFNITGNDSNIDLHPDDSYDDCATEIPRSSVMFRRELQLYKHCTFLFI